MLNWNRMAQSRLRGSLQGREGVWMSKMTPGPQKAAANAFQATKAYQATSSGKSPFNQSLSWYPIPTRLVDEVMPRLRDTELRVLLVVLRQTWGWKADRTETGGKVVRDSRGQTKRRDWLSHRQLCRRTGRGSEAVSGAVASLTASGLIIVEDAGGTALITPEERRRCLGRLYFRVGNIGNREDCVGREDE